MARVVVPDRRIQGEHSQTPADNLCVIGLQAFFMRLGQIERASARTLVMIDTLHQGRGEGPGLQRMAVLLQRAV